MSNLNFSFTRLFTLTSFMLLTFLALSWTKPLTISGDGNNFDPNVALNDYGMASIVWTSGIYPDLNIQSSFFDGLYWSPFSIVSNLGTACSPTSVLDASGNTLVAYELIEGDKRKILITSKEIDGEWEVPSTLSISSFNTCASLATNKYGQIIAGWIDKENNRIQITTQVFGKKWSDIETISSSKENQENLSLAIDASGNSIAVWEESHSGSIFVSQTLDGFNSTWTKQQALSKDGVNTLPTLSLDSSGNALIAWVNNEHLEINGSIFQNNSWETPQVFSKNLAAYPLACVRGKNYFISWLDLTSGSIKAVRNVSGTWEEPVNLSEKNEVNNFDHSKEPNSFITAWADQETGEITSIEFPASGEPTNPLIISDTDLSVSPKTASSEVMTVTTWEAILDAEHVIQVNIKEIQ
jgi:hypothetical protein